MREILLNALKSHYIGAIEKAKANIEIYKQQLNNE